MTRPWCAFCRANREFIEGPRLGSGESKKEGLSRLTWKAKRLSGRSQRGEGGVCGIYVWRIRVRRGG